MNNTTHSLTVKEAIEQGYKYAGQDGHDYQIVTPLDDIDFEEKKPWYLFDKESSTPSIDPKYLCELIADRMESDWGDETNDDTEQVFNAIKKLDFEPFAKMLNDAVSHVEAWTLTKIKLKP